MIQKQLFKCTLIVFQTLLSHLIVWLSCRFLRRNVSTTFMYKQLNVMILEFQLAVIVAKNIAALIKNSGGGQSIGQKGISAIMLIPFLAECSKHEHREG